MTHTVLMAYARMALGLPMQVLSADELQAMSETYLDEWPKLDYVWTGSKLMDEICAANRITRRRFIQSMAFPKPTRIQHMVYKHELLDKFGTTANLPDHWQSGQGLIIPRRENGQIVELKFHRLSQLLKPKTKVAIRH